MGVNRVADYVNTGYVAGLQLSGPPANPENLEEVPPLPPRLTTNARPWPSRGPRQLGQPQPLSGVGPSQIASPPGRSFMADQPLPGTPSVPQPGASGSGADLINLDDDDEDYAGGSGHGGTPEHSPNKTKDPHLQPGPPAVVGAALRAPPPPFSIYVEVVHSDPGVNRRYFWMSSCSSQRVVTQKLTMDDYFCKASHFSFIVLV